MKNPSPSHLGLALTLAACCGALGIGPASGQGTADSKPAPARKAIPNPALDRYNKVVTNFNKATQDFNAAKNSNNADALKTADQEIAANITDLTPSPRRPNTRTILRSTT